METLRCSECGRELPFAGDGPAPERCEDCRPETGLESPFVEQLGRNLRRFRSQAGIERKELARRARLSAAEVTKAEGDRAHEVRTTTLLQLCHSLDVSFDQITEGIYWNPAEVNRQGGKPVRLDGFFLVPPPNASVFDLGLAAVQVVTRQQAARLFGRNLGAARERRHFTQARLADAAGLSRSGLSLVERGVREATLTTVLALARALQVPPELLLDGIEYRRESQPDPPSKYGGARRHAARSRDREIVKLWGAGRSAAEIAEAIGTTPGTVSTMIHRLRERGEHLPYRRPPLVGAQHEARLRRDGPEQPREGAEMPIGVGDEDGASAAEVAARVGANLGGYRRRSGLSLRRLAEAAHLDFTRIYQLEKGKAVPGPAVLIKLAASLNVRCGALVAGVRWDSAAGVFRLDDVAPEEEPLQRLAQNALAVRRRLGLSQEAIAATASVGRYDLSDFEAGRRAFRVFTLVRVAAALEEGLAGLFTNVADWYVRPLPPPEYAPGDLPPTRAERAAEVIRLWRAGTPEREIAELIEMPPTAIGPFIKELRDAGEDIPYRRRPRPRRRSEHDRRPASPAAGVGGEPEKALSPLPVPTLDAVRAAELAAMLKALADPHRLQIVNMLAAAEEPGSARVRDFEQLGIAERAVAYHLKKLAEAGVVEREPLGRSNGFSLVPETLASMREALSIPTGEASASCELARKRVRAIYG